MNFLPFVHLGNKWNYFSQFIFLLLFSLSLFVSLSFPPFFLLRQIREKSQEHEIMTKSMWREEVSRSRPRKWVCVTFSPTASISHSLSHSLTLFSYGWGGEKTWPVSGKILVLLGSNFSTKTGTWREWEKETQKCDICFVPGKNRSVSEGERARESERESESEEKGGEERESWSQVPNTF